MKRWCSIIFSIILGPVLAALYLSDILSNSSILVLGEFPDLWVSLWSLWWVEQWLGGLAQNLYSSEWIFFPEGASLLLHNLTESIGILATGLPANSLIQRYNLTVLTVLSLNYLSALALFILLRSPKSVAVLLSVIATFHPYILSHLSGGHLNLVVQFPACAAMAGVILLLRNSSKSKTIFLIACSTGFAAYTDWYLLYFILLMYAFVLLGIVVALGRAALGPLFTAASGITLGLITALPKITAAAILASSSSYTANHDPAKHSADLVSFFVPAQTQILSAFKAISEITQTIEVNTAESASYIGVSTLILALLVLYRRNTPMVSKIMGAAAIAFFVLSLGPYLAFRGAQLLDLPFYSIFESRLKYFPPVPARLFFPGYLCMLASLAASARAIRRPAVVLLTLTALEITPIPATATEVPEYPALQELLLNPHVWRVVDLGEPERAMYRQTGHHKAIAGGFLARRPRKNEQRIGMLRRAIQNEPAKAQLLLKRLDIEAIILEKPVDATLVNALSFSEFSYSAEDEAVIVLTASQF